MDPFTEFQNIQVAVGNGTATLVQRMWNRMASLNDWQKIGKKQAALVSAGQVKAAANGIRFTGGAVGWDATRVFDPRAFAGVASDGRGLETLLYGAVIRGRLFGHDSADSLLVGGKWLETLTQTMIADAGRMASQSVLSVTPNAGYYRLVQPGCCQRCAVLAGEWYRWNDGFLRHPNCRCTHVPVMSGDMPNGCLDEIDPNDIRDLTQAQREAIELGADTNQVINSHRSNARYRDGMYTSEGMGRRGWARQVVGDGKRLTPEGIFRIASDQDEAARLLKAHGYILDGVDPDRNKWLTIRQSAGTSGRSLTAAERRLRDAELALSATREGRNPYGSGPLTDEIRRQAEKNYERWFATGGQVFVK